MFFIVFTGGPKECQPRSPASGSQKRTFLHLYIMGPHSSLESSFPAVVKQRLGHHCPPPNDSRAMSKFWKGSFPLQSSSRVHMTSGLLKSIPADYTSVVLTSGPLGVACTTHLPQPRLHYTQLIRETFCGSQQLSGAPCLVSVHKGFICLSPRGSGQVRLLGDGPVHLETSHIVSFALERSDSERLRSIADSKLTLHFPPLASAP